MDVDQLLTMWPISGPYQLRTTDVGLNNSTQFVHTSSAQYVMRIYGNTCDPIRVGYELGILSQLQGAGLPFAVPAPVKTNSHELFARVPGSEASKLAALFPVIPGDHPQRGVPSLSYPVGQALGQLVHALGDIRLPSQFGTNPAYGDLYRNHPLVPNPLEVPHQIPLDSSKRARLSKLFQELIELVPSLYTRLPQQIIHGDYVRANMLVDGHRVTGILDFEFTCWDLRAMDLAIGLGGWPAGLWGTGLEWEMLRGFFQGYMVEQSIDRSEIDALPTLMRLRRAASVLHLTGRSRQGLDPESHLLDMVDWALDMEDWLPKNGCELVERAHQWAEESER